MSGQRTYDVAEMPRAVATGKFVSFRAALVKFERMHYKEMTEIPRGAGGRLRKGGGHGTDARNWSLQGQRGKGAAAIRYRSFRRLLFSGARYFLRPYLNLRVLVVRGSDNFYAESVSDPVDH